MLETRQNHAVRGLDKSSEYRLLDHEEHPASTTEDLPH